MNTKHISQERCCTPLKGKAAYLPDWPNNPVKLDQIPAGENVGLLLENRICLISISTHRR